MLTWSGFMQQFGLFHGVCFGRVRCRSSNIVAALPEALLRKMLPRYHFGSFDKARLMPVDAIIAVCYNQFSKSEFVRDSMYGKG